MLEMKVMLRNAPCSPFLGQRTDDFHGGKHIHVEHSGDKRHLDARAILNAGEPGRVNEMVNRTSSPASKAASSSPIPPAGSNRAPI